MIRKNRPRTITVTLLFLLVSMAAFASMDIGLHGMLRDYHGMQLSDSEMVIGEQTIDLTLEGWGNTTRFVVNPYAYVGLESEPNIGVREAYVDLFFDSTDLRIGKQAIVWGQAEGAFITDIVSPRDMRSFIIADFKEIRMGIPALRVDHYLGPYTLEGIWIPRFVPARMPAADSMWSQAMTMPNGNAIVANIVEPPHELTDGELFGKVSFFGSKLSWELMGGYAWTDEPHVTAIDGPGSSATLAYGRHAVTGGSFSMPIGSAVLRGEAAIYIDKPFSSVTFTVPNPTVTVETHHQLQTLVGIDWSLLGMDLSAQYLLSYIHEYHESLMTQGKVLKELAHTFTFRMQETYASDRLTAKLFLYLETDPLNALIRPSLSWSIEDGVSVEGGVELFAGDTDGTFGSYADNSLAFISLRWYF